MRQSSSSSAARHLRGLVAALLIAGALANADLALAAAGPARRTAAPTAATVARRTAAATVATLARRPSLGARLLGRARGLLNSVGLCRIRTPINMSNRHWHPTSEALAACFGNVRLEQHKIKDLSQPGEFATDLKVDFHFDRGGTIKGVRVLGPVRDKYAYGQAEFDPTDFAGQGLQTPAVNDSGDHRGTIGATVVGPHGSFEMKQGVMAAGAHIHASQSFLARNGLRDGERVDLVVGGKRPTTFHDLKVRLNPNYGDGAIASDAHLDKSQAGAVVWSPGMTASIKKHGPLTRLRRLLTRTPR